MTLTPYKFSSNEQRFITLYIYINNLSAMSSGLDRPSTNQSRPRLIVFIVGGVTYSEIRCAYEIQEEYKKWQVYIGSNERIDPSDFMENLSKMN